MGKHKNSNIDLIKYYYENTSLSINQIAQKTNISSSMIRYYINKNNYIRSEELSRICELNNINRRVETKRKQNNGSYFSEDSLNKSKQTRYNKNNGNYFSEDSLDKLKQTNIERYGVSNPAMNDIIKNKIQATKLERYGDKNYNNKHQAVETRLSRYDKYMTTEMLDKSKQTSLDKYGSDHYSKTYQYKIKSKQTRYNKCNGKYFSDNTLNIIREKALNRDKTVYLKGRKSVLEKYKSFVNCFYTNEKLLDILKDPQTNFIKYINELDKSNRNFAFIENDLNISYSSLLNYSHKYNFKKLLSNSRSHFQQEVITFIESLGINYIENVRSIISPYELDIFIPEYNVAIECNGNYWHSSNNDIDKNYHYNKSKLCDEKNIRLIHIFEYEWYNDRQKPILENIIRNALGINENKIYARKCNIVIKESKDMKEFFNKNNIQGFRGGKFSICLEYDNEIIMAYMMGHPYFGKGKYQWEVIRGATKLGYTVVGGASKIWNYFIKTYNPNNCVYYIDYNYFNGSSLKNLPNMEYIKTQISFKNYFKNTNIIKNRDPGHNKEIVKGYKKGDILQIWNAGTKLYVWHK